jgi:chromosome partitioning protein
LLDWIVVRNRLAQINSRNKERLYKSLNILSMQLGCRLADGISERVIFRELFPKGLTVLDNLEDLLPSIRGNSSHMSARQEVRNLIATLKLPIDELSRKRTEAREKWLERDTGPVDTIGM